MANQAIAIEIESSAIKIVHLKVSGSRWEIVHAAVKPLGEIERFPEGEHRNMAISKLILEAIPPGIGNVPVVVGLSGRSIMVRFVQAPRVNALRLETLMTFEAESQAVGSRGGLAFDFLPLGIMSTGGTQLVALAVSQQKTLKSLSSILEKCSLHNTSFSCGVVGLANSLINGMRSQKGKCELIVDIGAQNISLVLVKDRKFVFSRAGAGGGSRIIQSIRDSFGVSEKEAREILEREGKYLPKEKFAGATERQQKIHQAISTGLSVINSSIQSTIMFANSQLGAEEVTINKVLLTGGVSRLQGIESVFESRLGVPVEKLNIFEGATKLSVADMDSQYQLASAVGLALAEAGLGMAMDIRTGTDREAERSKRHDFYAFVGGPILAVVLILGFVVMLLYSNAYEDFSGSFKKSAEKEKKVSKSFERSKEQLAMERETKDYLFEMISPINYFLEVQDHIKATLDNKENEKQFKYLFLESISLGDKDSASFKEKTSNSRFTRASSGSKHKTAEPQAEKDPEVHLIGWSRSERGSQAVEIATAFADKLMERKDLIADYSIKTVDQMEVENGSLLQIKFEIILKMKR